MYKGIEVISFDEFLAEVDDLRHLESSRQIQIMAVLLLRGDRLKKYKKQSIISKRGYLKQKTGDKERPIIVK